MSLPKFLHNIRMATGLLSPAVQTDSASLDPTSFARTLALADLWLTTHAIEGFDETDFVFLSPEDRARLADEVAKFRAVAESVPPTEPATRHQVEEARAALGTILRVLEPYLSTAEARDIERILAHAVRPDESWIPTLDFKLGNDATGDPAVWVWLIVNDDVDVENADVQTKLQTVRNRIDSELAQAKVERFPYTLVRSRSEVKELLGSGAA
jgi:hypothetical protein